MGAGYAAAPAEADVPKALRNDARRLVTLVLATTAVYFMLAIYVLVLLTRFEGMRIPDPVLAGLAVIGITQAILYVAGGIQWLLWLRGANLRLRAAGRQLQFTPGMAIAWYFIPIANLVMPLKVMQELWRASSDAEDWQRAPVSPLINAWWPLFIGGNIITGIGVGLSAGGERTPYLVGLGLGTALVASAGVLALMFIRQLEWRMAGETLPEVRPEPVVVAAAVAPEPVATAEPARADAPAANLDSAGSRIGGDTLTPRQSASWLKLLENPRTGICPNCNEIGKPMTKGTALGAAAAVLLVVPLVIFGGTVIFGAETMHNNSLFLGIAFLMSIGIAWQTAKAGWNSECQRCQKAAKIPLSDELRAEMIAEVRAKTLPDASSGNGGAR